MSKGILIISKVVKRGTVQLTQLLLKTLNHVKTNIQYHTITRKCDSAHRRETKFQKQRILSDEKKS